MSVNAQDEMDDKVWQSEDSAGIEYRVLVVKTLESYVFKLCDQNVIS